MSESSTRPQDGPATSFQADPMVQALFSKEDDYFGLVLVAGWPPNLEVLDPPYQEFLKVVRQCFSKEEDGAADDDSSSDEAADDGTSAYYLYPTRYLHVTVATLYPTQKRSAGVDYDQLKAQYTELVQAAAKRPKWPTTPLQFQIHSTQLGSKAGILLWTERTGGLQRMRDCLRQQEAASSSVVQIHSIPGIVHSTFLRFAQVPSTPSGSVIQQRFQSLVVPKIKGIFSNTDTTATTIVASTTVKLVCATTPYMHIPNDDQHVLCTVTLFSEAWNWWTMMMITMMVIPFWWRRLTSN
jgi:hypothetical protein